MFQQRRTAPAVSAYESQAARWKQGFNTPGQPFGAPNGGGASSSRHSDLEGALIAELCSSIGSSSFPPRDVLQKLLRHLPNLDHIVRDGLVWNVAVRIVLLVTAVAHRWLFAFVLQYVCELLDDKFQNRLWQVQGKALSVLDVILKTAEADHYKLYYHERMLILHELCNSRKDIVKNRAEKVFNVINEFVPPPQPAQVQSPPQEQYPAQYQQHQHQAPVYQDHMQQQQYRQNNYYHQQQQQQQQPEIDLLQGFDDDLLDHSTVISTSDAVAPETPAPSAFGFIGAVLPGQQHPALQQQPTVSTAAAASTPSAPPMTESGFGFLNTAPPAQAPAPVAPAVHLSSTSRPAHDRPLRVEDLATQNHRPMQQQYSVQAPVQVAPAASAFAFIGGGGAPAPAPAPAPVHRPVDVWDALPAPIPMIGSGIVEPTEPEVMQKEEKVHDPIRDAFEGLSSSADSGLDSLDHTHVSLETPYPNPEPTLTSEPLREVILDIELPPGPMGLVLDRTIADMAVIERFILLPSGDKGYLEMHPAICPGCALISINSVNVENKGLEEVGPVLAAFSAMPKVLRFKKLMNNGRTANPSTLLMPYIPPPPEEDEAKKASNEHMVRLTEYSESLDEIEKKLEDLIRREQSNIPIVDRKNQLAQLHGNVEKIQTQGIDSVILGPNPPPNFDEVKKFRSSLVRKADALTKRIQRTVDGTPESPLPGSAEPVGSPVSAFSFVSGGGGGPAAVEAVNNDPLTLPPVSVEGSSFHFLNPSTPPVQMNPPASSFAFMQETATPASSFAFLQDQAPQPQMNAVNSVFAGLSVRDEPTSVNASSMMSAGPLTLSALTLSSSTSSTGSTLDASGLGFGLGLGMGMGTMSAPAPTPASSYSAFGFMANQAEDEELSSSAPSLSSPTAFGFLRSSDAAPAHGAIAPAAAPAPGPASSAFAFISS